MFCADKGMWCHPLHDDEYENIMNYLEVSDNFKLKIRTKLRRKYTDII